MTPSVTLELDKPVSVGEYLAQVRNNQLHQNVQISCRNGRVLESQLMVGLIFYEVLKDINYACLPDSVIIMPEYKIEEVSAIFTEAYNQSFKNVEDNIAHTEVVYFDTLDQVKQEPEEENDVYNQNEYYDLIVKKEHNDENGKEFKYFCSLCQYKAKRSDHLKRHAERMHTQGIADDENLVSYACDICSYTSKIYENFRKHKKSPCTVKSEKCPFCDKRSKSKDAARKHRKRYHEQEREQNKEENKVTSDTTEEKNIDKNYKDLENEAVVNERKQKDLENEAVVNERKQKDLENGAVVNESVDLFSKLGELKGISNEERIPQSEETKLSK